MQWYTTIMDEDTKKTTVYLPAQVHKALQELAKRDKRSFNSELVVALEQFIRKEKGKDASQNVYVSLVPDQTPGRETHLDA